MNINKINDTDYKIYYYKNIIDNDLYEEVKRIIKNIQKKLKLNGFYKVLVIKKKIGLFIELSKMNDTFYKNTLELKIEVKDNTVYYKTTDYFLIKDSTEVRYKDGMYYCVVDDSFEEILEKVEFGDFVFGYDIFDIMKNTYVI
jgi:hypothetical protein